MTRSKAGSADQLTIVVSVAELFVSFISGITFDGSTVAEALIVVTTPPPGVTEKTIWTELPAGTVPPEQFR
jgi:hypothetical protein